MSVPNGADVRSTSADEADDGDELSPADDWPTFYTQVPHWIMLASVSPKAKLLYQFFASHLSPGKSVAFPKQVTIAIVLELAKPEQVKRYTDELVGIGAVVVRQYRHASRGYPYNRYTLRFNPPDGWAGPLSLTDFYARLKSARGARTKIKTLSDLGVSGESALPPSEGGSKVAGQGPTPSEGGKQPPSGGGRQAPLEGGQELEQGEPEQGELEPPTSRTVPDGRRPLTQVGDGPGGASAAPGTMTSANGTHPAAGAKPPRAARSGKPAMSVAERHGHRAALRSLLNALVDDDVLPRAFVASLPGILPNNLAESYGAALEGRSRHQVGERIARRWGDRGYAHAFTMGEIRKPVGALFDMLARPECPDFRCEDGFNVDSGAPCARCSERIADRRAAAEACPDPDCVDGVNERTDTVCVHCHQWAREVVERRAAGDVPPNPFLAGPAAATVGDTPRVPDQRGPADGPGAGLPEESAAEYFTARGQLSVVAKEQTARLARADRNGAPA